MYVSFFLPKIKMRLEARQTKHFLTLRAKEYILLISILNFVTLLSLFRKRKVMFCLLCKKQLAYDIKINFCSLCKNRMGFFRYNPKPKWQIQGQLCKECWDSTNKSKK